jgi:hypothetical protein
MKSGLTPEAKLMVVVASVVAAIFVGPVITAIIIMMSLGIVIAPWPAIAAIGTVMITIGSWQVIWGRYKSDFLLASDWVLSILLILGLLAQLSQSYETVYNTMMALYATSLLQILLHSMLALFVATGISPSTQLSTEAKAA